MTPTRDQMARIICYWDTGGTCHDAYCIGRCFAITPDRWAQQAADEILGCVSGHETASLSDGSNRQVEQSNGPSLSIPILEGEKP